MSIEPAIPVESPCISICEMDETSGLCIGCYRTRDEIAVWARASNAQRMDILDQLRVRRVEAGGRERRQTRRRNNT